MINQTGAVHQLYQQMSQVNKGALDPSGDNPFKDIFKELIKTTSETELKAQQLAHQFALGDDSVSIHKVMIESQKSLVYLKATTEVSKRCLSAYQEIWNMHI